MPKIQVISRTEKSTFARKSKLDIQRIQKSTDPNLHPFQRAREFQRALTAAKYDKIFAKPFVASLAGHYDGISCFAKSTRHLNYFASGAWDGQVRLWDLAQ
jgi:DDB1- and CUL4-associated factor 13